MGDSDDLEIVGSFAIDDEVREAADGNAAGDVAESNSGDSSTDLGMLSVWELKRLIQQVL